MGLDLAGYDTAASEELSAHAAEVCEVHWWPFHGCLALDPRVPEPDDQVAASAILFLRHYGGY